MNIDQRMDSFQKTHKGFTKEAVLAAEQRLGVQLPQIYREYLMKYGLDKINYEYNFILEPETIATTYEIIQESLDDEWQEEFEEAVQEGRQEEYADNEYFTLWQIPESEWHTVTDNYVIVWTENQGVWNAGYLLRDLQQGKTDPPVYISTEDDFITFAKYTDGTEAFLEEMFRQAK